MKKKIHLFLIHFPVWAVALFVSWFFGTDKFPDGTPKAYFLETFTFIFWLLGSFYIFYAFLVPKYLEKGRIFHFGIFTGLFILVLMPLLVVLSVIVSEVTDINSVDFFSKEFFLRWLALVMVTLFPSILGVLYRFSTDWFNNLHIKDEIENIKLKSELKAIKSRLNPHFLFNTLNNIDTLIQSDPPKASVVLTMLSDLFRYVVYEAEKETIEIGKELEIIQKYVDLEKIRLSNPEAVSFTCSIDHDFLIPPMIFMPFIENAFKHCNLNDAKHTLSISFVEKNHELTFRCTNSIFTNPEYEPNGKGIGLQLIKERLKLMYPARHRLQIIRHANEFDVTLIINIIND
jgi:hypothetical protein